MFATGSTDTSIRVWDVRKFGAGMKPVAEASHAQTCQEAYFCTDGEKPHPC